MSAVNKLANNLILKRDLSPEGREINYKGRIRQVMHVISANMTKLVLLNLIMVLACAPMIVLFGYYMRAHQSDIIAGLNFSSGIGVGFGVSDDSLAAIERIYDFRLKLFGFSLLPCSLLAGLFASGLYYCCRNLLCGANVKIFKHFFRGIKAHWYKFMLSFAWLGVLATGFACSLIMLLKETALYGHANAGWWVLVIVIGLIALLSALYMMIGNGMYVCYKYKMKEYIVNTASLVLLMIVPTILITVFLSGVMALSFINMVAIFILVFMALIGFSALAMFNLAFSQYVCDNMIGYMYEEELKVKQKEQEKLAKQKNQAKKKQMKANSGNPYKKKKK